MSYITKKVALVLLIVFLCIFVGCTKSLESEMTFEIENQTPEKGFDAKAVTEKMEDVKQTEMYSSGQAEIINDNSHTKDSSRYKKAEGVVIDYLNEQDNRRYERSYNLMSDVIKKQYSKEEWIEMYTKIGRWNDYGDSWVNLKDTIDNYTQDGVNYGEAYLISIMFQTKIYYEREFQNENFELIVVFENGEYKIVNTRIKNTHAFSIISDYLYLHSEGREDEMAYESEEAYYLGAIEIEPESHVGYINLTYYYLKNKEFDKMLKYAQLGRATLVDLYYDNSRESLFYACEGDYYLYHKNNIDSAVEYYYEAFKSDRNNKYARSMLEEYKPSLVN